MQSPHTRTCLGVDFGGTSVKVSVIKGCDIVHQLNAIPTQSHQTAESLIHTLISQIQDLRSSHPSIAAVGVGVPGFVNSQIGLIHNLTNVPGWQNLSLAPLLQEQLNLPCTIENDANCMAIAETRFGAAKGFSHAVCLTLGTGVGGGIIVDGKLLHGARFGAGEIGQTSIDFQGRAGYYNNRGALEKYVGNREIADQARQIYALHGIEKSLEDCSPKNLSQLANDNDPIALKIWNDIADKLACALVNCCYLLNPEVIVIGGGVAKAGKFLFEPLERNLRQQMSAPFIEGLTIQPARFGNEAGMIGAAAIASDFIT